MNSSSERKYFRENLTKVFSFALTIPFAVFLMHWLASYWAFFDYGVNGSANSFGIIVYLPLIFVALLIAAFLANFISDRLNSNPLSRILLTILMLTIFSAVFFSVEVWRMRDYPNPNDVTVGAFLKNYFGF